MSTTTEPSMTTSEDEGCCIFIIVVCIISAAVAVSVFFEVKRVRPVPVKYLTVAVESTTVRYYNVTPDDRVVSIIGVGIRAGNPDPDAPPLKLTSLGLYVMKGKHTTLADSHLPGVLNLTAGSEVLVHGEAFGLVSVPSRYGVMPLDAEVVEEIRADLAAGEGIVKVKLIGCLGKRIWMFATCEDVVIDCSGRSATRAQKVDCQLIGRWLL